MYPEDEKVQNQIPYKDQVQTVQAAINQFQKDNGGILPIKTLVETTPFIKSIRLILKECTRVYGSTTRQCV